MAGSPSSTINDVTRRVYNCLKPDAECVISRVNAYEALRLIEVLHMELLKASARRLTGKAVENLMKAGQFIYIFMTADPNRSNDCTVIMLLLASVIALGIHGSNWSDSCMDSSPQDCDGQSGQSGQSVGAIQPTDRVPIKLEEMQIYVPLHSWATSTWWDDMTCELPNVCKDAMYVLLDDEFAIAEKTACAMALFSASLDIEKSETLSSPSTIALHSGTYLRELQKSGQHIERINAIADMSDSEIGQQVIRDLITSFLLPRIETFPRSTTLFNSDATRFIMEYHPDVVRRAHMKAQLTGPHLWRDLNEDELERTCVILAGIAVYLAPDIDAVRKKSAFNGRVQLPFVQGKSPNNGPFLRLTHQRWSCYVIEEDRSQTLQYSGEGLLGLQRCALLFTYLYDSNIKNM